MAAAIAFDFLHPVLLAAAGFSALAAGWAAPPAWRSARWWPAVAVGAGAAFAALLALIGAVPWFGKLHLAAYAACMIGGFALAFLLTFRRAPLIGMSRAQLTDAFLIAVVLGVVGARIRYVYERWDQFLANAGGDLHKALVTAADIDRGGAVWYGGALLATIGISIYLRHRRIPLLAFADIALPALIGGLAVGRIGCLLNGCCYGAPTDLPWGISCAHYPGEAVHPTQVYESIACAVLAGILYWAWGRRRRDGQIAFWGVVGYAVWRFGNEALRGDHDAFAFGTGLTTSQATSIWLVLGAMVLATVVGAWRRRHPEALAAASRVPGSRHAPSSTQELRSPP